jgi:hypothetical protein
LPIVTTVARGGFAMLDDGDPAEGVEESLPPQPPIMSAAAAASPTAAVRRARRPWERCATRSSAASGMPLKC